jgi:NitT/TauT family transport system substrate-binding protein
MKAVAGIALFFFLTAGSFSGYATEKAAETITFIPQWIPQAQFAGYYVALDAGIYQDHGLDVTIRRGGPERPSSKCLEEGIADVVTMFLSTGIERKASGADLVNIAQVVQRSSLMLVAKKSNGIYTPADMNNKKVGLWNDDFQVQPNAFFHRYNLDVQVVPQSTTVNLFLRDGVAVASAMWYNEYHTIINSGIDQDELTTFFLSDHSVDIPEDGIYCREEDFHRSPGRYCTFVRASLEGWRYAFDHPEEALDIVMKYTADGNDGTNRVHQRWMLHRMEDLIMPESGGSLSGILPKQTYDAVAAELRKNDLIQAVPPYREFFISCGEHD